MEDGQAEEGEEAAPEVVKPETKNRRSTAGTAETVAEEEEPAQETDEPVAEDEEPAPETEEPVAEDEEPAPETEEPVAEDEEPAPETEEPVTGDEEPAPEELELELEPDLEPEAEIQDQIISVKIPRTGRVILNPYGMPLAEGGVISREPIVSGPMRIISKTGVALNVLARMTGKTNGNVALASTPIPEDETDKKVFLYCEFQNDPDGKGNVTWNDAYAGEPNQLTTADPEREVMTLPAAEEGEEVYGVFRMFGALSSAPAQDWGEADQVEMQVIFNFSPVEDEEELTEEAVPEDLEALPEEEPEALPEEEPEAVPEEEPEPEEEEM